MKKKILKTISILLATQGGAIGASEASLLSFLLVEL